MKQGRAILLRRLSKLSPQARFDLPARAEPSPGIPEVVREASCETSCVSLLFQREMDIVIAITRVLEPGEILRISRRLFTAVFPVLDIRLDPQNARFCSTI